MQSDFDISPRTTMIRKVDVQGKGGGPGQAAGLAQARATHQITAVRVSGGIQYPESNAIQYVLQCASVTELRGNSLKVNGDIAEAGGTLHPAHRSHLYPLCAPGRYGRAHT